MHHQIRQKAIIGRSSDALVELVDIFPTLTDLAGLEPIPTCPVPSNKVDLCTEGSSFAPLVMEMTNKTVNLEISWKKAVFSQYPRPSFYPQADSFYTLLRNIKIMGYSMRTNMYRYTEWVHFNHTGFCADWSNVYARELYVHHTEPLEDINRAYEVEYEKLVQTASHMLHQGWPQFLPPYH
jgi:iduronate 2-sulfatase